VSGVIAFQTKLHRPGGKDAGADWTFLRLPESATQQLPSRSMVSVEGTFNDVFFQATLQPDGEGGHWLKVEETLRQIVGAKIGDDVVLEITPMAEEPEPDIPDDFQAALDAAPPKATETWRVITPLARRDWIFWIVSGKKAETRTKRIEVAISKLSAGSRRPCCFDRSGMYSKSLSCPVIESA
jgi:hypothetical protein